MSKQGLNYFNFHLVKKNTELEIVEQRFQLAAMLNICLKLCSRPPQKKARWIAFHGINPKAVIIVDSREMSQTIHELLRLTTQNYDIKNGKITWNVLGKYQICLCIFIIVCPVFQEENLLAGLSQLRINHRPTLQTRVEHPSIQLNHIFCIWAERIETGKQNEETHVNVTRSVTFPLAETVLSSSGRAERHRRIKWMVEKKKVIFQYIAPNSKPKTFFELVKKNSSLVAC